MASEAGCRGPPTARTASRGSHGPNPLRGSPRLAGLPVPAASAPSAPPLPGAFPAGRRRRRLAGRPLSRSPHVGLGHPGQLWGAATGRPRPLPAGKCRAPPRALGPVRAGAAPRRGAAIGRPPGRGLPPLARSQAGAPGRGGEADPGLLRPAERPPRPRFPGGPDGERWLGGKLLGPRPPPAPPGLTPCLRPLPPPPPGPDRAGGEAADALAEELEGVDGDAQPWSLQEKALHEARLKAKGKRRLRRTSSRDSPREGLPEKGEPEPEPSSPKGKNHDRKSRMGKGRGLPKKGGAGGKGVWGAPGLVYSYQEPDARDPNYDEAAQGKTVYATVVPELEEEELEKTVQPMVLEYFEHGDTLEVVELLRNLNLGGHKAAVSSLAVVLSLEGKASHRELTSRLLSDLVGKVLSAEDIAAAFDGMLHDLPDLILDTPEAPQMLGQFIARAVADHALPLNFLERYKGRVDCEHARAALDRAAVLLRIKRDVNQLDNVWGVGGGQRPVKHLIKEMNLLLREYLLSGEVSEAERCLRQLEVPHFHHELVYEAVVMVMESSGDTAVAMMVKLLKVLWQTGLVTLDQMNRGFQRVYNELGDISLDVPLAYSILERMVDLCFEEGVITRQLRETCPARGRKRFVSEGDGGQIKQ
ncbi:programmed cell death protein 4-like [Pantherophis guttatus]|uniref:Programmed cell death protein 4-like n=1 Tax=Pantherophis guttatus TaxID=94885 RepID=A0ABM3YQE1_PANGU|nr:programmed cell death protein 4-like [Pantherophis guttatus]